MDDDSEEDISKASRWTMITKRTTFPGRAGGQSYQRGRQFQGEQVDDDSEEDDDSKASRWTMIAKRTTIPRRAGGRFITKRTTIPRRAGGR